MKYCLAWLSALLFCGFAAHAQPSIDSVFATYQNKFPQEKIYVHFDKAIYTPGDTIWFKAYIRAGLDPSDFSRNFYTDWYDEQGTLVMHTAMPVYESSAKGQLAVPAAYKGHVLQVKAYTKWMLNFDHDFLYTNEIKVQQANTAKASAEKSTTDLQFFPEGGDLSIGLSSRVAFKATDNHGHPVKITGVVKNSQNTVVAQLSTKHDGMGSFDLKPVANDVYTAYWQDESGTAFQSVLPAAGNAGIVLSVEAVQGKTTVTVLKNAAPSTNLQTLNLIAHINQHLVFKAKINIGEKVIGRVSIPTNTFPSGVMQITLFDANWKPLAERVSFINNHEYSYAPFITNEPLKSEKHSKVAVEIGVPDLTVSSNLSVAITDADLATNTTSNIFSQLLLSDDLKGKIYNPAWYFSGDADSISEALDLVMLTHGWRKFNWQAVSNGVLPAIVHARDTDFLQLRGKAEGVPGNNKKTDETIILMLQAKDSSRQMMQLPVNANGTFSQGGMIFFDTIRAFYSFSSKNWTRRADLKMNSGLLPAPTQKAGASIDNMWQVAATVDLSRNQFFQIEKTKIIANENAHSLNGVTVRSRAVKPEDLLDKTYASGMFTGDDGYRFDVLNDVSAQGMGDVFAYLQGKVPGLQVTMDKGNYQLTWRGARTELFLDQLHTTTDILSTTSMADVAYIKVFRPPFFGATGGGSGGAIAVYTRKGMDVNSRPGSGLPSVLIGGYTAYRQFYSPKYENGVTDAIEDARTTLYWNPYVLTDAGNHNAKISFYRNDVSKRYRIIVEGILSDGRLVRAEKVIE